MTVTVDYRKSIRCFVLSFTYSANIVDKIQKGLPLRSFNKATKEWEVPELAVKTLENLLGVYLDWTAEAWARKEFINQSISQLINCKFDIGGGEVHSDGPTYREYQNHGIRFLEMARRAILADDMGLGKTLQSIQAVLNLGAKKVLILCPSTLKWNWHGELEKHFNIQATIIGGTAKKRQEQWENIEDGFYIAAYDLLRHDKDVMPDHWDAIIADEAVYLKNPKAQRTVVAKTLKSDVKIALSGMPLETKLEDFHSIFQWVRPELATWYNKSGKDVSQYAFDSRYCVRNDWKIITGYKNLDELHSYTSPFILRREKNSVLTELPPKIHTPYPLELDGSARKAYREVAKETIQWLQEQTGEVWQKKGGMAKLQNLMQFVENPNNLGFDKVSNIKMQWLGDTYEDLDGKMVVFVNFLDTVEAIRREFNTKFVISGDVDPKERVDLVDEFNNIDRGLFVMTDAGRFGLNITGAHIIVNYGYSFNPASMAQREDRLHRFGQQNTVHVLNPFVKKTIDEKVLNIAERRLQESKDFMQNSNEVSLSLSNDDIMDMICAND